MDDTLWCIYCPTQLSRHAMQNHYPAKHANKPNPLKTNTKSTAESGGKKCPFCGTYYATDSSLKRHKPGCPRNPANGFMGHMEQEMSMIVPASRRGSPRPFQLVGRRSPTPPHDVGLHPTTPHGQYGTPFSYPMVGGPLIVGPPIAPRNQGMFEPRFDPSINGSKETKRLKEQQEKKGKKEKEGKEKEAQEQERRRKKNERERERGRVRREKEKDKKDRM